MTDNSSTGVFDNEVHYPLKKMKYDGNIFHLVDLAETNSIITGNKAWKLKYNIEAWKSSGAKNLLTFGGAYSNHIYQTAKLGYHLGIPTIGMIRGEIDDADNPTLMDARGWGMTLIAIDRSTYRKRNDALYIEGLRSAYNCYIVPEGGTNEPAIQGTTELGKMVDVICDEQGIKNIAIAVGTGGTIAGIINGTSDKNIVGYAALKGNFLQKDVAQWITHDAKSWSIVEDSIFGGYGRWNQDLIDFIKSFHDQTGMLLEPIYTGKMLYAARKLNRLNQEWLYIHTGGAQGNRGFNQRFNLGLPTSSPNEGNSSFV